MTAAITLPSALPIVERALRAQKAGDARAAVALCREALALDPDNAFVHRHLGFALHVAGDAAAAGDAFASAVAADPLDAESHAARGWHLTTLDRLAEAADAYAAAVRLAPETAAHWMNLGTVRHSLGRLREAAVALLAAHDRDPASATVAYRLGNVLADDGAAEGAVRYLRLAVEVAPEMAAAHNNLGIQLQYLGAVEEAVNCFARAVAIDIADPKPRLNLARCFAAMGRRAEARAELALVLEAAPDHGEALALLLSLDGAAADTLVARAEAAAADPAGDRIARLKLSQALGKYLDAKGDFERAFAHFERFNAAALELSPPPVDPAARVDALIRAFGASALLPDSGIEARLIFIVGMPRSGTTLVEAILAKHPEVEAAGELPFIPNLVRDLDTWLAPDGYPAGMAMLEPAELRRLAQAYLDATSRFEPGRHRVTDKLPLNFWHVGLIARMFPQARFIHCHRAPLDTCVSCFFEDFNQQYSDFSDLARLGRYYRQYARLMAHWHAVLGARVLALSYEALVTSPEVEVRRLLGFLDLPWEPACLVFHDTGRAIMTPSAAQVRQPLYQTSVGRWRHYAPHLAPLIGVLEAGGALPAFA